jgi:hypothetical protein
VRCFIYGTTPSSWKDTNVAESLHLMILKQPQSWPQAHLTQLEHLGQLIDLRFAYRRSQRLESDIRVQNTVSNFKSSNLRIDDELGIKNTDGLQNVYNTQAPTPAEYIVPSSDLMITTRINANDFFRHETILVKLDQSVSRNSHFSTMLRRRVAQTLLLFKCRIKGKDLDLAYVNCLKLSGLPKIQTVDYSF